MARVGLDVIEKKLEEILDFFYTHNECFPEYNEKDEVETKLYDFRRKIKLYNYYDIDEELLEEYKEAAKKSAKNKCYGKSLRRLLKSQDNITSSIDNYYNFYLENGYFPTNSKSSSEYEIKISRAYTNILNKREIYTKNHKEMISIINEIKENIKNRKKLLIIKQYVDFCYKYGYMPKRKKNSPDKDDTIRLYEHSIASKFERINMEDVRIPKTLQTRYIKVLEFCAQKEQQELVAKVNSYMNGIISFMKETNATPYERKYRQYQIDCDGVKVNATSALNFIDKNINLVDDKLIETYNSFDFVKVKK